MIKDIEFINRLAEKGYTKRDAKEIIQDFERVVLEALADGEEVQLRGFGTFCFKNVKEHQMRDVHTHEWITVPAYKKPKFLPGNSMKRAVVEGFVED